jgi:two-component system LytT family sensor kinase
MDQRAKYIGFDDRWFITAGIPVLALLVLSIICGFDYSTLKGPFWMNYLEAVIYTTVYWFAIRWSVIILRKRFPEFSQSRRRIVIQVLLILLFTPLLGALTFFVLDAISNFIPLPVTHDPNQGSGAFATYLVCFLMIAIYEAVYFYSQLRQTILEQERVKRAHIRSQLESLRNQINPHFLFNSMNTLMNIVQEDQQLATSFLEKLSKVYRYILENREEKPIPLSKELDFIQAYVFLQQERFRGNLTVSIDIPEERLEDLILPLSLQILFENAIKHNIISSRKPLRIRVFLDEQDKLTVTNNLQRKSQVMHSTKVGLENIRMRYNFFTNEAVDVQEGEGHFTVRLPLLTESSAT